MHNSPPLHPERPTHLKKELEQYSPLNDGATHKQPCKSCDSSENRTEDQNGKGTEAHNARKVGTCAATFPSTGEKTELGQSQNTIVLPTHRRPAMGHHGD